MSSSFVPILLGLGALVFLILVVLVIRKMASGQIHEGEKPKQLEPAEEEALAREALGEAPKEPEQLPPPVVEKPVEKPPEPSPMARGLAKTKQGFMARVNALLFGGRALDPALVDELEEVLVTSDIGIQTTQRLLDDLRKRLERKELADPESVRKKLKEQIEAIVGIPCPPLPNDKKPVVIMVIGVNGVGKTTTIGKLASRFTRDGKKVVLAAGDTFRAAAVEQLEIWAKRSGAELVKGPPDSDPASVAFEAVQKAQGSGADVAIADTAGRLHTKVNLMEELKKVRRVMSKALADAPHEVILVLDATTGQNAIAQAREFTQAVQVSSIALTKLDGTAKGGVVVAICDALKLPVRYVGIGESVEDLRDFDPHEFTEALFARDDEAPRVDR